MTRDGFVYIAGPYRRPGGAHDYTEYFDIDSNINEACRWAAEFAKGGIPFFCPHLNSAHFEVITPDVTSDFWLEMDLKILAHASALFLMPGWFRSEGAGKEYDFAVEHLIPVFTLVDELVQWWRKGPEDAD